MLNNGQLPVNPILNRLRAPGLMLKTSNAWQGWISRFMSRTKTILTVVTFLIIGAIYFYVYGDAFKRPVLHISHTVRPGMGGRRFNAGRGGAQGRLLPTFSLNGEYKLTSIRVVAVDDLKTNKFPRPLWELESKSNSVPVRIFIYGVPVRGMQPVIPGAAIEPLATNVQYRLYVAAGRVKGEHDFMIKGEEPQTPAQ
jgi:hypothetical protein